MALVKRTYVDGETIITAQNLNDIQDEIISHANTFVPKTRTINSKALDANITLTASDLGAVPTTRTVNSKALSSNITLTAADVSAVPTTRTVNSKALSSNITLSASDVGAVPTTRTVNSKALSSDITLTSGDIGYNSSTTYSSGTIGKAVNDLNGAITNEQEQITSNIETGSTASKAYSAGEFLLLNGVLYKVITAIASGASFTVGTNIEQKTVTTAITRLTEETCFASSAPTKLTAGNQYNVTLNYPLLSYVGYTLKLYSSSTAQSSHSASVGEFRAVAAGDHTVPFYMDGQIYTLTYAIDYASKKFIVTSFTAPNLYIHRIFGTVVN